MNTLEYIFNTFQISSDQQSPIRLPYSRQSSLPTLFAGLEFKTGAEIGVDRGRYSEVLCQLNPGVKLFCIDPWIVYGDYLEMRIQDRLEKNRQATIRRLKQYDCTVIRSFSFDTAKRMEPESLDFVYIDGNHTFEYVVQDIVEWSKIVRPGGIISGHDYYRSKDPIKSQCHVIEAVDGYTKSHKINPWFLFMKDRCPSWMWVKQ